MSDENGKSEELPRGFIKILREVCKGCELCTDACPQNGLRLSAQLNQKGHRYVEQDQSLRCTGCSLCYVQCPSSVIVVYRLKKGRKSLKNKRLE